MINKEINILHFYTCSELFRDITHVIEFDTVKWILIKNT